MIKALKIIGAYIFAALFIVLFVYMDTSQELQEFLKSSDKYGTHREFEIYLIVGITKLFSLIAGVTIPLTLTIMLIREKMKTNSMERN